MRARSSGRRERCEGTVCEPHRSIEGLDIDAIDGLALRVDQIVLDRQHDHRDTGISEAEMIAARALRELRRFGGESELLRLQPGAFDEIGIADQSEGSRDADDVEVEHETELVDLI